MLRLADMISERSELDLQIQVCTSFEQVERLEDAHVAEILLIDEEIPYERRKESKAGKRFVLTGYSGKEVGDEETAIYKYQSVHKIFSEIMEECLNINKEGMFQIPHRTGQKLLVVYSPVHRIGKSGFAKALGKELAKKESALYLNLQEYPDDSDQSDDTPTLADLIYYSGQEKNHFGLRLTSMVYHADGVDMLAPIPVSRDLKEVEKEVWESLIVQILQKGPYQYLILDLSESVQGIWEILNMSDIWYLPFIQEKSEEKKLNRFFEAMETMGYASLARRAILIEMKGDAQECAERALYDEQDRTYGKTAGTDYGETGSVERDRGRGTDRFDLSRTGRICKRQISSVKDESRVW